jgi:hypothetical protein
MLQSFEPLVGSHRGSETDLSDVGILFSNAGNPATSVDKGFGFPPLARRRCLHPCLGRSSPCLRKLMVRTISRPTTLRPSKLVRKGIAVGNGTDPDVNLGCPPQMARKEDVFYLHLKTS